MSGHFFGITTAFVIYLFCMMMVGFFYWRRTKSVSDYILGGRSLNSWVTSLSAEASDMSGWMLLGLPGFAYASGVQAGWIALGLIIGTYLNWKVIAVRLRKYTHVANDSLTLPDYFRNRFQDKNNILNTVSAIFILIFFLIYTSSGFVAGGKLFNSVFGIPYIPALLLGALVVVSYTFIGGFMAVCWTDAIQGVLMFFSILLVPMVAITLMGGPGATIGRILSINPELFNPFTNPDGSAVTLLAIISLMAWGLGYFGQPHILVRFMAINSSKQLPKARHIAMTWVIISLIAACGVGLIGRAFLPTQLAGSASETVFMVLTSKMFFSFMAGIIMSGILAAIMSTASSQLLVTSSAISQDLYKTLIHKNASEKELVFVNRLTVLVVAGIAVIMALNPNNMVLSLVAYAWAGFGATFGPLIILSLFWKRMTLKGALAGIIVGGLTVLVWKQFAWFGIYEIIPGFFASMLAIYIVSMLDKEPSQEIKDEFDSVAVSEV